MELRTIIDREHVSVVCGPEKGTFRSSVAEAVVWPLEEGVWWINRVLVNSPRGKGTGSKLLQRLIEEIRKKGGKAIIVAPGGYNANINKQINFYVKNGFKEVDPDGLYRLELGGTLNAACSEGG